MPNTTTPYGIAYPTASDSVAPLHTAFSTMADSVNTALNTYVAPLTAGVQNNNYTVASTAAMNALTSVPAGSRAFVTADKSSYIYSGVAWVPLYKPWTTYSPTAITNFTFNTAEYMISDNKVTVFIKMTTTGTPTANPLTISNPVNGRAVLDVNNIIGSGTVKNGSNIAPVMVRSSAVGTSTISYASSSTRIADVNATSTTAPISFATGTVVVLNFTYPLA